MLFVSPFYRRGLAPGRLGGPRRVWGRAL